MPTETVLIEFVTNDEQLKSSEDRLVSMGKTEKQVGEDFKKTNAEIKKQEAALATLDKISQQINSTGKVTKNNLKDLATAVKSMSGTFQAEFKDGVTEALKAAGVSIEQFEAAMEGTEESAVSLKSQLRQMVAALAQMKVEGKDNTEEYRALAQQAGELRDTLADVNQEVRNLGSDTDTLDGLIGVAQGIAGGFAVAQGAAALFGDESEELQKTLLRVNAAMAILQGLQQIQVVFQRESAAAQLANTIATRAQTAAQVAYNFVVGTSTGLLKAFRIALAATGVGLLVIGLIALVKALKDTDTSLEDANKELERQKDLIDGLNDAIDQRVSLEEARAKAAGAAESELIRIQGRGLQAQREGLVRANTLLAKQRDALDATGEAWGVLNNQIIANNDAISKIDNDTIIKGIEFQKQVTQEVLEGIVNTAQARSDAAKKNSREDFAAQRSLEIAKSKLSIEQAGQNREKILSIQAELNKKLRDINKAEREHEQKSVLSDLETRLLKAQEKGRSVSERITQDEIDVQKKIIITKARFEAEQEGLSQSQITQIKTKAIIDASKLQRDFSKQSSKEVLEDFISRNNAELSQVEISEREKLSLQINTIIAAAQIEVEANEGNYDKIKEINAKRDRDIKEARLASIKATLEYELSIVEVSGAANVRALQKSLSDQDKLRSASNSYELQLLEKQMGIRRLSLQEQIDIINELSIIEAAAISKRLSALNEEKEKKLITQKDYDLQYAELIDQQTKIWEDAEAAKTDATKKEGEKRKQQAIKEIQDIVAVAQQVVGVLSALYEGQSQSENNRINEQKQRLKDLTDAGAITEKEALSRQKRIDAEERKIKQQQAQRDKQVAVFRALLAIPEAVLQGLSQGGPVLAAIYGALAAVQAALVIARPIPKFGKGKKNRYEGLAEVGETGAEIIQRGGRMYLAPKKTITYLGASDKVFSPMETKAMLSKSQMNTERVEVINGKSDSFKMDYDKLGKAVGKHVQTNVYVDGIQEQTIKKNQFTKWLNDRRSL